MDLAALVWPPQMAIARAVCRLVLDVDIRRSIVALVEQHNIRRKKVCQIKPEMLTLPSIWVADMVDAQQKCDPQQ